MESPQLYDSNKYPKHIILDVIKCIGLAFLINWHLFSEGFL